MDTSAEITLVDNPYRDPVIATDFQFEVPDNAHVEGIAIAVIRSALDPYAADDEVRLVQGGSTVGADRADTAPWSTDFESVTYGGPTDTWAETWAPRDVKDPGFGVSLTPKYLASGGNTRGYVDSITATVYYSTPCD